MSQRKKEEERRERIIRGLLKLPENKRCINCNQLVREFLFISWMVFSFLNKYLSKMILSCFIF